jgi:hypothetical protein
VIHGYERSTHRFCRFLFGSESRYPFLTSLPCARVALDINDVSPPLGATTYVSLHSNSNVVFSLARSKRASLL